MISNDITLDQYNHPPIQIEYQIPSSSNQWQQQQLECLENKIKLFEINDDKRKILLDTINTLKIPITLATELFVLCKKNIYLIIDDSNSMATEDTELFDYKTGNQLTRIDELKIRLQAIATILCTLAKYDIKIITLSNYDFIRTISASLSVQDRIKQFNEIIESLKPTSSPYLISATSVAVKDAEETYAKQDIKSILYIFTNGMPNDINEVTKKIGCSGFMGVFNKTNLIEKGALAINCSGCAGKDNSISWSCSDIGQRSYRTSNNIHLRYTDIITLQSDFFSEANAIKFIHGNLLPCNSYGFYIAIGLLAPVTPWLYKILASKHQGAYKLTKSELSILTNRSINSALYGKYISIINKEITDKHDKTSLNLEIITLDGKTYEHKVLPDSTSNKTNYNDDSTCIVL